MPDYLCDESDIASITFKYAQSGYHETITLKQILDRFRCLIESLKGKDRGFAFLMFILDVLMLLPWVTSSLDFNALIENIANALEGKAPAEINDADKISFTRVVIPLSYPHSVLGGIFVAWKCEGDEDSARSRRKCN